MSGHQRLWWLAGAVIVALLIGVAALAHIGLGVLGPPEARTVCLERKNALALAAVRKAVPIGSSSARARVALSGADGFVDVELCDLTGADSGGAATVWCPVNALCDPGLIGGSIVFEFGRNDALERIRLVPR